MKKFLLAVFAFAAIFCITTSAASAIGDIDGNGKYTEADVNAVLEYLVSKKQDESKLQTYDISGDGFITLEDALAIVKHITDGSIPSFCKDGHIEHDGCVWNYVNVGNYSEVTYTAARYDMKIRFRIYVPKDYSPTKQYALATHLHGLGGENIPTSQLSGSTYFNNIQWSKYGKDTILLLPQCPVGMTWPDNRSTLGATYSLIKYLTEHMSIDTNRLYLSGHSNGSKGVAYMLMSYPNTFAAAVMGSGASAMSYYTNLDNIATTPIWMFCGSEDPVSGFLSNVRTLYAFLKSKGADVKYTEFEGLEHNIFSTVGNTDGLVEWVFSKTLSK